MSESRRFHPVERLESGRYVLLLAISFTLSVIGVRGFLELTGYPQLGSTTLHIAHLLWGGLALTFALLAVLIFANRWIMLAGSVLGGVGVGLFIDEVGKFITVDNDYLFPWAAPIIYAVLLVLVLLVLLANRNQPRTPRTDLYHALEAMTELIDDDLEASERARIEEALERVLAHSDDPVYRQLAEALLGVARNPAIHPKADRHRPAYPDGMAGLRAPLAAASGSPLAAHGPAGAVRAGRVLRFAGDGGADHGS